MARPRAKTSLESSIESILSGAAAAIANAVRQDLADQLQRVLGSAGTSRRGVRRGQAARPQRVPPHCIFPGCSNPSKGPRFTFMCEEHKGTAKSDKKKYLEQWKAERGAQSANGTKRARRGKRAAKKAAA